jgi:hypothetical protein
MPALLSVANWVQPMLGGVWDVALIHYPSCTDSIKPSLQCSCNFVVIYGSEGSLSFQIIFKFRNLHAFFNLGIPYAGFHGMPLTSLIEGFMIPALWTHLRMFLNSNFWPFYVRCGIMFKPVIGGVNRSLNVPIPSMNRLIKPNLQQFQFYRFGLSLRNLCHSILKKVHLIHVRREICLACHIMNVRDFFIFRKESWFFFRFFLKLLSFIC